MALCDAQHIDLAAGDGDDAHVGTGSPPAEPDDTHVGTGTGATPDDTHVGTGTGAPPAAAIPVRPPRATQAIPPAVGRLVRRRQQGRCAVPGCRCHSYIDLHHLRYRHDGKCGPDDIIGLCWAHHQRVHAGLLLIVGTPSTELRFYHADGSEYGRRVSADALAVRTQAFNALVGMGFRKQQVREALAQVCAGAGGRPSLDSVIRQALDTLTSTRTAPPVH